MAMPKIPGWARQVWLWLTAPRAPTTWAALRIRLTTLPLLPNTYAGRLVVLVGIVLLLLLLVLPWYAKGHKDKNGVVTYPNAALVNPILAGLGAILLIYAAIRQAQIAASRHEAQTEADRQRRITESFSNAIEQLGSDKLEVRLGGIYALERISQESAGEYWAIMDTLTAFVRQRARWQQPSASEITPDQTESPADITAVIAVIIREREREIKRGKDLSLRGVNYRWIDLRGVDLRGTSLSDAHLEGANLSGTHLERVPLIAAHLEGAYLEGAYLEGAYLTWGHLEHAHLKGAHLERARLDRTHLGNADLYRANLRNANLEDAQLDGANLSLVEGLTQAQIDAAYGDAATTLPEGLIRPVHWTGPTAPKPSDLP
jgi:hypothetical protein